MGETFGIGEAVKRLKDGKHVSRAHWTTSATAPKQYIFLESFTGERDGIIYRQVGNNTLHWMWLTVHLLADDWYEVPEL